MAYKLINTERAEEQLDDLVFHLLYHLKSKQAVSHLLNEISKIYDRIQDNPYQFPICRDDYLKSKEYHEAIVADMNYIVVYKIEGKIVYIMGIFHQLEDYGSKI